ncbi:pgap2-interacting protein [Plakobranchus ocellatus]|uniref:PGAP2-interacting protein n=1 Tax=Plakobranchus ocellatus TaxID=259542 RepID=A0AAV3XZ07_9GAST|nr:pgap2-interacting protein [Plakobranchus ocellatus]
MATATLPASAVDECQNKVTDNAYSSKAESKSFIHFCRLIARDTFYGFVFWSVFQGLAPMIWFYPLNELEISGYEVFALVFLSPVLCLIPGFLSLIQNKWILILLRLLVVGSLASFQAPTTLQRLVILAIGVGIAMLVLAASLWHPNKALRYRTFWGLILGLHLFLACRVWFVTFVPTWWDKESNSIIVATGAVFACGYILEDLADGEHESAPTIKHRTHWLPCGLSLGSLFCLTQMCFGEASLITRWTVKGYPDTGPVPLLWSSLVLLSLLSGTLVGRKYKHPVLNALLAAASMFTLYLHSNPYVAFAAGCCLAHLTMCLWPVTVEMATQSNPGLCLGVAALTYLVNVFFWVWTVAYNFVPYGEYTREHTDWLILMIMGSILLMTICYRKPVFDFTVSLTGKESLSMPNFGHYAKVLFLIFLVGQCGMVKRFNKYQPGPRPKADHKTFTAGIWTFHFGYDNKGWPSMERAAQMINDTGVDVLTLLESDASKIFLGNNDLATWLGERLNFYVDFGPSTKDHTWGNLILSKYPIVKSVHHLLPSPEGELAPAITASINISGTIVDFVVTHMGNDRDVLDRKLQSQYLAKELKNSLNPAVFLGYVTSAPGSDNYHRLLTDGEVKDIDPSDKHRWCEYIMYKRLIRMGYARISHGGLSDTEVQIGTFRIPQNMKSYQDNKRTTVAPEKHNIDKNVIFNSKFGKYHRGHGHFDHHGFHMDTPKYFYND